MNNAVCQMASIFTLQASFIVELPSSKKTFTKGSEGCPFKKIAILITISFKASFIFSLFSPHNLSWVSLVLSLLFSSSGVCNTVQKKVLEEGSRNKTRAQMRDRLEGSNEDGLGIQSLYMK